MGRLTLQSTKPRGEHHFSVSLDFTSNVSEFQWPPPPRPTPVIVPARMMTTPTAGRDVSPSVEADKGKSRASSSKRGRGSSLHKAVMERLEVKKAKDDLARGFVMEVDQE